MIDTTDQNKLMSSSEKHTEVLALIPARGGSKSIPRKNIVSVMGKPLIAWTIETALECNRVSRVIVTTDDLEIADTARSYGAEVPFIRPTELAQDMSRDIDYHIHAIEWLRDNEGYLPDLVINLRPTAPNRQASVIDKAIEIFEKNPHIDSLRSIHLASQTPFKMWTIGDDRLLKPVANLQDVDEPYNEPRQALPLVYWQDGYIDITRPDVVLKQRSTTGRTILPFIVDNPAADIDYVDDIQLAEDQLSERLLGAIPPINGSDSNRHPS